MTDQRLAELERKYRHHVGGVIRELLDEVHRTRSKSMPHASHYPESLPTEEITHAIELARSGQIGEEAGEFVHDCWWAGGFALKLAIPRREIQPFAGGMLFTTKPLPESIESEDDARQVAEAMRESAESNHSGNTTTVAGAFPIPAAIIAQFAMFFIQKLLEQLQKKAEA